MGGGDGGTVTFPYFAVLPCFVCGVKFGGGFFRCSGAAYRLSRGCALPLYPCSNTVYNGAFPPRFCPDFLPVAPSGYGNVAVSHFVPHGKGGCVGCDAVGQQRDFVRRGVVPGLCVWLQAAFGILFPDFGGGADIQQVQMSCERGLCQMTVEPVGGHGISLLFTVSGYLHNPLRHDIGHQDFGIQLVQPCNMGNAVGQHGVFGIGRHDL